MNRVLVASDENPLKPYKHGTLKEVMALDSRGDARKHGRPPAGGDKFGWFLCLWEGK